MPGGVAPAEPDGDLGLGRLRGQLVSAGDAIDIGPERLAELERAMQGDEVEFVLTLPGEGGETEIFFSDLSEEYVTYNASYTS